MYRKFFTVSVIILISTFALYKFILVTQGGANHFKIINGENIFPYNKTTPKIGIIDTGIQTTHQSFKNAHISQYFLDETSKYSQQYHGTMVAGIMIANSSGLIPKAQVISIQAGTDMGMTSEQLADAINLAVSKGVKILNISSSTTKNRPELQAAVKNALNKGVVIVASNGNKSSNKKYYPASYDGVISVGGINSSGDVLNKSDIGLANIFALGHQLETIVPNSDKSIEFEGNSAAAPILSSVAAIILSKHPTIKPHELKELLINSATVKDIGGKPINILNVDNLINTAKEEYDGE
ncbi:S8 family serine peptidase [Cytobacillus firmus]|uniref:S8 family peptidase n=1 Tax=Cytobacillus firmus TaxID=1399 RepID=UPI001C974F3E|nr:S8 family serine peptidase [Cytobacillus firmus]MBY6051750.1 S8 family serine peptidase [Cytobacillus firmus]